MIRSVAIGVSTFALIGSILAVPPTHAWPSTVAGTAGATAMKPSPARLIIEPRANARIRSHTVRIAVRAKYGIVRATLNNVRLTNPEFDLKKKGRRTLLATSSHGLKHGRNTLTVVTKKRYQATNRQTVRFTVKGKRTLVGAGRDQQVAAGSRARLRSTTRLHPSLKRTTAQPSVRWKVLRSPKGSAAVVTSTSRPRLLTDEPGRYVVQSAVTFRGRTLKDTVEITAPAGPMQQFNAFEGTRAGVPAVRVNDDYYPIHGPADQAAWQVVVFDRNTLERRWNRTYGPCGSGWCASDRNGTSNADLGKDLASLSYSDLVVLVHREQFGKPADSSAFADLLSVPKDAAIDPGEVGAIIGVPRQGLSAYMDAPPAQADMSGYMMWDNYENFTYVDDARVPFDTRSEYTCDTNCSVTVTVGDHTGTYSIPQGQSGLVVSRFDRRSLAFRDAQVVLTGGTDPAQVKGNMDGATRYLKNLPKGELVVITSLASPGVRLMPRPAPGLRTIDGDQFLSYDPATRLAEQIASFGGTTHKFLQAAFNPGDKYTLVGWKGLEDGQGHELHNQQGRLTGVLVRDRGSLFEPQNVTEAATAPESLTEAVMGTPGQKPWPGTGDPRYKAALTCLAKDKQGLNPDNPRASYWSAAAGISLDKWLIWASDVKSSTLADCPGVDPDAFAAAQADFQKELRWNSYVRTYIDNLKKPFSDSQAIAGWADSQKIAAQLKGNSDWIKAQGIEIDWFALAATFIEIAAPFLAPEAAEYFNEENFEAATHALAAAFAGALEYAAGHMERNEKGMHVAEEDEFTVDATKIGFEIVSRLQNTSRSFDRMGDMLVADYGKLATIGPAINCGNGPQCDPALRTQDDVALDNLITQSSKATEKSIIQELLPLTYPATLIPRDGLYQSGYGFPAGNWDAKQFTCFNAEPFAGLPRAARPFVRTSLGFDSPTIDYGFPGGPAITRAPQFESYAIAAIGKDRFNVDVDADVIARFFGKQVDQTDPSAGGLGVDPVDYIIELRNQGQIKDYPLGCGGWPKSNPKWAPTDR